MEEQQVVEVLLVMTYIFLIWEMVKTRLSGWSSLSLGQLQEEGTVIPLFFLNLIYLFLEEIQDKKQLMMFGV